MTLVIFCLMATAAALTEKETNRSAMFCVFCGFVFQRRIGGLIGKTLFWMQGGEGITGPCP